MSEPTASSAPTGPARADTYPALQASLRARCEAVTAGSPGPVRLFLTRAPALYGAFLDALAPELRQQYTCSTCRRFVERFGRLVSVTADGTAVPVMWDPDAAPEPFRAAVAALAAAVSQAPIEGVFLSTEATWGVREAGGWQHFAATPAASCLHRPSVVKTAGQAMAEKREEYASLCRGLEEFSRELVTQAHALLSTEQLARSEASLGVATWLVELHARRAAASSARARENLTWLAVAGAPPGFCHVRSSMIGTLLEDLAAGLPFAEIKGRFDAKMHPLQYQRPTAAPKAGNIAQAEKIVAQLKSSGALGRRFARLDEIQTLWRPAAPAKSGEKAGVFSHLKPRGKKGEAAPVEVPPVVMTWEKFARTVLPTAERIEFLVPRGNQPYMALVTALDPSAPPIVQWDAEERRNPVTWYFYTGGSAPEQWNLRPDVFHPVAAIALQPTMWDGTQRFKHHGEKAIAILEGARDLRYTSGAGFFPEFLKTEYHPIRATMEAYAKDAVIAGKDEASACGVGLQKGSTWNFTFRVTAKGGVQATYRLDRWD